MTLDVTIGRIVNAPPYPGGDIRVPVEWPGDEVPEDEVDAVIEALPRVERCPDANYNVSNHTAWPRESYRSGSIAFWEFFESYLPELYERMRFHPGSNDTDVAYLEPIIGEINALNSVLLGISDDGDRARMTWLLYWSNKAVELYGPSAGIEFS